MHKRIFILVLIGILTFSLTGTYLNHLNDKNLITKHEIKINEQSEINISNNNETDNINKYSLIQNGKKDFIGNYKKNEQKIIKYIKDFKGYKFKQFGAEKFARSILFVNDKYNIDIDIFLALIKYESGFRPSIVHERTACIGATQINFKIWGETLINEGLIDSKEDLFDITSNVICGAYILNHYMKKHDNNIELALQRYYGKCNYALIYSDKVLEG